MATTTCSRVLTRSFNPASSSLLRTSMRRRWQSQLTSNKCNPHIYVFPDERSLSGHLLTLLPTSPPNPDLAIGSTSELPPTTRSFRGNQKFMSILQSVVAEHASGDPIVVGSAQAYASSAGSGLGMGQSGAGGASAQGGAGGANRGGYVHVYDLRHPPDFGRIPDPEDIFGSVEVDGAGNFVDGHGRYQDAGMYRLLTPDGLLGLSDYLRGKLVERLKLEEQSRK